MESCYRTTSTMINPIIDWSDDDVWEFIRDRGIKYNPLYDEGHKRVGCIGCPLAGQAKMRNDFKEFPGFKNAYIRAFDKAIVARKEHGLPVRKGAWETPENMFDWWVGIDKDQITIEQWMTELEDDY